jgi:hypothetical protein
MKCVPLMILLVASAAAQASTSSAGTGAVGNDASLPTVPDRQPATLAPGTLVASAKDSGDAASPADRKQRDPAEEPPVYVPPRRGAPETRVGGGTRSGAGAAPDLLVLGPPHTGLTEQASPALYWWLSQPFDGVFELVVTAVDAVEPVLKLRTEGLQTAGVHELSRADQGVQLEPGREYQWSVAIVRDPERRSRDVVAVATIERTEGAPAGRDPAELAAAGLWYDAIEALSEPDSPSQRATYRAYRADLLSQVGLEPAAAAERAAGR